MKTEDKDFINSVSKYISDNPMNEDPKDKPKIQKLIQDILALNTTNNKEVLGIINALVKLLKESVISEQAMASIISELKVILKG